ncbi:hypothetical protein J120_02640 [candidate division TM6 bacterium JCVI TM6SC1]|uniref:Uncharacterized protein n=1 Tax=candidate division TM6 bacterium JCVI TM6SC1 TaxID=1306947 RepID=A0A0D2JDX5_9BACT|nr:hypothetical protein J120_02640 [candidate division TM6 bacterium JCVI TM6SC1]
MKLSVMFMLVGSLCLGTFCAYTQAMDNNTHKPVVSCKSKPSSFDSSLSTRLYVSTVLGSTIAGLVKMSSTLLNRIKTNVTPEYFVQIQNKWLPVSAGVIATGVIIVAWQLARWLNSSTLNYRIKHPSKEHTEHRGITKTSEPTSEAEESEDELTEQKKHFLVQKTEEPKDILNAAEEMV